MSQSTIKICIPSLILLLFLMGCIQGQQNTVTPTPTPTTNPNSQLKRVDDFVSGLSQVPSYHYLFVEVTISTRCSSCDCQQTELPPPSYEWYGKNHIRSGGILIERFGFGEGGIDLWEMNEDWRLSDLQPPPLGFLGFGTYPQGLDAIIELPISTPDKEITLHSVDSQGNIVAEIHGIHYFIEPSQSWIKHYNYLQDGCAGITSYRLTNKGLLDDSQIFLWNVEYAKLKYPAN